MPNRAPRECNESGCRELVVGSYCPKHEAKARKARDEYFDAKRGTAAQRGYDARWRRIRAAFLKAHPSCSRCPNPSAEAHHRVELRKGGTNEWSNLEALCKPCHSSHTARTR